MKRDYCLYLWIGFAFTILVGSALHFLFEWSGYNELVAAFSAVNESTWEHLKIFFIPTFIYGIYEYFKYGKRLLCFWRIKLEALLLGMAFITVFYFTYRGILGFNVYALNLIDFFASTAVSYIWQKIRIRNNNSVCSEILWFSLTLIILVGFIFFTYYPPEIGLFQDPVTYSYGIQKQ